MGIPGLTGPPAGRSLVVGVVNVTPDSFSDGGSWLDPEAAIAHGLELVGQGADLVDVGGESTRPGAERVSAFEELRRVLPVVSGLTVAGVTVSIDTTRAEVAAQAVAAGAAMINDVSGARADPDMPAAMARAGVPVVLMHWRAPSTQMQDFAAYDDVVAEVAAELRTQLEAVREAGVSADRIVLDPGLGFAKNADHNWALLAALAELQELGHPILVGASRKRFLGELLGGRDVDEREHATTAITTLAALAGVWGVRVHDARAARDAVAVVERLAREERR
jgi:dihydropteroate synthase